MIGRLTLAALCLATPALAQSADEVTAMTMAIEAAGCSVTADNGDAVLAASGLDEEQTMAVIAALYEDGLVALEADGSMSLSSEACS
ncbi:hypothetical protein [Thalassorhabdomicrobium marinisediminis]|uniref:Uncharacterized protein n=1 Tax=Thalassorhabdomicrobium marinisediminis TaxID=2170577 RepID=A0A2T7G0M8_9RHOB|nr:hypothetical protein [Thalassorhabdomicrobium marinisediminis]PVA07960.1 hypothetical protein DC363_00200 [Thalassorhabdomicrobium marinisediminis]